MTEVPLNLINNRQNSYKRSTQKVDRVSEIDLSKVQESMKENVEKQSRSDHMGEVILTQAQSNLTIQSQGNKSTNREGDTRFDPNVQKLFETMLNSFADMGYFPD